MTTEDGADGEKTIYVKQYQGKCIHDYKRRVFAVHTHLEYVRGHQGYVSVVYG